MFVHLSSTSPYLCDITLGPIEEANRMALTQTKQTFSYLEAKESFPRLQQARTPLKLLAPEEIPIDHNVATAESRSSRQPSLQPIWYTEQSISDASHEPSMTNEQHIISTLQGQQRNSSQSSCHRHDLTRSTLPTIESYTPDIEDEIIEKEEFSNQPSLMRKSSTFTIEPQPSVNIPETLNESEKENEVIFMMTSTQKDPTDSKQHSAEPTEDSFRSLEHLLGLGSNNVNTSMVTSTQESPKSNHESLSLTMVTPTELINQTGASLQLSYAPACGSLPTSQNILLMPTIESITEPSINSTMPPPFSVDNSVDEESPSTVMEQDTYYEKSNLTEDSFHFTDDDDESEKQATPKDDTNTEDDSNFSFELNDFPNSSKDTINESLRNEVDQSPAPQPMITIRAPTCTDVALRALIKPRTSARLSQTVKTESPLAKTSRNNSTLSPLRSRRMSVNRSSINSASNTSPVEEINPSNAESDNQRYSTEAKTANHRSYSELVEVISLPEEDETDQNASAGVTLNLTTSRDVITPSPSTVGEADRSASLSSPCSSSQQQDLTPISDAKIPDLSCEYSYNTPTPKSTRTSERRRSALSTRQSYIPVLVPEPQTTITEEESNTSTDNTSFTSDRSPLKPVLSILTTNPSVISEAPPIILQKSLAGSASPSPNPTPIITIRKSGRLTMNESPRRSLKPYQSSTPSIRKKSLQMVSIGEQEQVSTVAPAQLNITISKDPVETSDKEQQVDIPIQIVRTFSHEGVQTSPERRPCGIDIATQTTPEAERRHQNIEQQTTPIAKRSSSTSSCQTTPVAIAVRRSILQQTSPIVEKTLPRALIEEENIHKQVTPVHTKAMVHLRRNVRFQFTPSTDARLAAKEKEEEDQRMLKQQIVITTDVQNQIPTDNEREEDTEDEVVSKKKKIPASRKKKQTRSMKNTDDSSEEASPIQHEPEKRASAVDDGKVDDVTIPQTRQTRSKISKHSEKKILPEPEIIVLTETSPPAKRANRKRPNPKQSTASETTSPTEPVVKRAKTTKTMESKETVREVSPEASTKRSRSKTPVMSSKDTKPISSSVETDSIENPSTSINNKRKASAAAVKKSKRRLHNAEQDEGLNTADEEETSQAADTPVEIFSIELSQEEREKIEGLTVAELKTRLATHGENIPKGVRKADLVTLLIKIETNLLKERKEAEKNVTVDAIPNSTSRKMRRRK